MYLNFNSGKVNMKCIYLNSINIYINNYRKILLKHINVKLCFIY